MFQKQKGRIIEIKLTLSRVLGLAFKHININMFKYLGLFKVVLY